MMLLMRKYIFLTTVLLLCGCSTNTYLTIDVLKPAKQPVLQKTAEIALVTDVFNPAKCGQYYVYDKRSVFDSTCRVRRQAEIFMEGVQDVVGESQFFTDVANIGLTEKNMPFSSMLSLSQDANPDILLVLTDFKMKDETWFLPSIYGGYAVMKGTVSTSLAFYDTHTQSLLGQKTLLDTVYWISEEISPYEFTYIESDRESLLKYLAYEAGKKVASYFFPAWVNVTRVLIVSQGEEAQHASKAALAGSWERANYFWEALSKEKNKKKQSAAWFNRAVYQETNGDFETAMDFVKRADALHYRKIHHVYLGVLEQRMLMQQQFEALMSDD
jgi:hypothetical protein